MQLDHATIVTRDLEGMRHVLCRVAGLEVGPRPPFGVRGYWLYAEGRAVLHLVEATVPAPAGRVVPRIDHIAFRIADPLRWAALLERLRTERIAHQHAEVPATNERQLFVALGAGSAAGPGFVIEFVTELIPGRSSPIH